MAIILSCIDSRTSVELIFDQGLGDVFSTRIAGNIVNDDILGCMEFACKLAGSKLIVVLGHSHCVAIKGACSDVRLDHLTGLLEKIKPAVDSVRAHEPAGMQVLLSIKSPNGMCSWWFSESVKRVRFWKRWPKKGRSGSSALCMISRPGRWSFFLTRQQESGIRMVIHPLRFPFSVTASLSACVAVPCFLSSVA